jgi:hypothetical protein
MPADQAILENQSIDRNPATIVHTAATAQNSAEISLACLSISTFAFRFL